MKAILLFFIFVLLLFSDGQAQANFETKYVVGPSLSTPLGVVIDDSGNMYVANSYQVRVLDAAGNFVKDIPISDVPFAGQARAIAKDKDENLYVWNAYDFYVYKLDKQGNVLHKFKNSLINSYTGSNVEGIAVGPDGSIYITDVTMHVVRKFTNDGQFLLEFGSLNTPTDVAIAADGNVYVADSGNKRIVKFNASGLLLATFTRPGKGAPNFGRPTGVEIDKAGLIFVADAGNAALYAFTNDDVWHWNLPLPNIDPTENLGVNFDKADNKYITASGTLSYQYKNGRIITLLPGGERENIFGIADSTKGSLSITALETDSNGFYFYVADNFSKQILTYNRQGIKLSMFGETGPESAFKKKIYDIAAGPDGSVYVLDSMQFGRVRKFSAAGKVLSEFDPMSNNKTPYWHGYKLTQGLDRFFYILGEGKISKYDDQGNFLQTVSLSGIQASNPNITYKDIAVDEFGNLYVIIVDKTDPYHPVGKIKKYANSGQFILQFEPHVSRTLEFYVPNSIELDQKGNIYVAGSSVDIFDTAGKLTGNIPVIADEIAVNANGSAMAASMLLNDHFYILGKTSDTQQSYISGIIYQDTNKNNVPEPNEARLKNIALRVEPGSVFGFSDVNGNYKIAVDNIGTYQIRQLLPDNKKGREIQQSSPAEGIPQSVTITDKKSVVNGINFGNQVTLSPYLNASVSSTRRRRCFESTTKVTYTNSGFATANNAKVYLQLPKEVELLSADKSYTRLPNGTYVFEAGTIAAGQTGFITIQDKVVCGDETIRGLTVCTKAWITPGNQSTTPVPTATVTGVCNSEKGMVRFVIRNSGLAGMETGKQFRLYLDGQLSTIENYKLATGDSLVLWIPTGGKTARLEADQPEGNGENSLASATVEACRKGASGIVSTGYVNALPPDDEEAEAAEECLPIIDSFDPNDKLVIPAGLTEEKYTSTGTELKYKIRFQNTGTDVAYRVVVADTLSEHLDLSTLRIGSASHSYRFEVSGKGRPVLTWTFDNIMLPDSTSNEPGSHGYIQFSIKPKADLPEKTAVENFADIYFDYNSPVRTNVTTNRIYDMPPVINEELRLSAEQIIASPGIAGFSPAAGKYGTEVILTGKKFAAKAADNKVYFNGVQAQVISATETELKVQVPSKSVTGSLKIETPDGAASTSESFEVYQPPLLSSFSPIEGVVGATVTLQGQHLDQSLLQSIKLGMIECEIISNTGDALVLKVPAQAATAKFEITTKGGETLSASAYVVWHQPEISGLSKKTDIVGATISISGENFAAAPERNKVWFGQVQAQVVQASPTMLTVKVPQGAASGYVAVETPGGKANSATYFDVIPGPAFLAMAPLKGSVGTDVEITGAHFLTLGVQDEIAFNGEKAHVLEASPTKLKVRVPRGATTGKLQIKGVGGVALSTTDFVVETLTPAQAIAVYPNPTSGRFIINLQHADFDAREVQLFNAVGKLVYTATIAKPQPDKIEINAELTRPGVYLLQIHTERGIITKKLTVL
ncbi:DUF7619 domain-containing protein [Pontibacter vulgaris]|uniref:DUF7619 domain-containing protein n=1 Tax=Pontibacter vulgaris TaxID=2905679 RepID=UPI001FA70E3F|nr:IPT/TIG domain-containing protein [Pontibacter vulgaris]